jgi:hypothetical protein
MSLRDRIGIDVGRRLKLEEAIEWAAQHEVRWIDIQLDSGANALSSFDARAPQVCVEPANGMQCISGCTLLRRSMSQKWRLMSAMPSSVTPRPTSRSRTARR